MRWKCGVADVNFWRFCEKITLHFITQDMLCVPSSWDPRDEVRALSKKKVLCEVGGECLDCWEYMARFCIYNFHCRENAPQPIEMLIGE